MKEEKKEEKEGLEKERAATNGGSIDPLRTETATGHTKIEITFLPEYLLYFRIALIQWPSHI